MNTKSEIELQIRKDYLAHCVTRTQAKIRVPPLFQHYDPRPDLASVAAMLKEIDLLDAELTKRRSGVSPPII